MRVERVESAVADELCAAWRRRQPLVVELVPGLGLDDWSEPPTEAIAGLEPWQWSVELDLCRERLHHGLWANAYDARSAKAAPAWRLSESAVRLGARATATGDVGDVTLADGTTAWLDGGPLDAGLDVEGGAVVVHAVTLEHGSLRPLGANLSRATLAADQLAAVTERSAGARVIAPAGAGKTRVLTERARLVLEGWGIPPGAVALVAYNVRAAAEMSERLEGVANVRVRTLNALGLRLCGRSRTLAEPEVRDLLGELCRFPRRAETDPAAPWLAALGRVRLGLEEPDVVEAELPDVSELGRVAVEYRARLAELNAADFDEQIVAAIARLLGDPAFRRRTQRGARVLLVDEFQDLTPAHILLLRLLSGPAGAVFGVGDDDQTIYGYAGATPRWLVDFGRYFPGSAQHALEVNYRCPAPIVTAAANLLSRNALRVEKVIRPARREDNPDRPAVVLLAGAREPGTRSAARVRELLDSGVAPGDIAVLARVNAALAPVQVLLRNGGVPTSGGVDSRFLQRGGVRAALAWLEVATAPATALPAGALREAARRPRRGLSASLLDLVAKQHSCSGLERLASWLEEKDRPRDAEKLRELATDVAIVRESAHSSTRATSRGGSTAAVLEDVRRRIGGGGLDASASALDAWSRGAIASHSDDLDALSELAFLEPDAGRFPAWLASMLAAPAPTALSGEGVDEVTLASVHSVKGREWRHVVVHHATEGLLPHRLATDAEEERRVFHVALTRASESVAIVSGEPVSSFLAELDAPGTPPVRRSAPAAQAAGVPPGKGPTPRGGSASDAPAAPAFAAVPGATFRRNGYLHTVVALDGDGVVARVGDAGATSRVAFLAPVTGNSGPAVLAHPHSHEAFEELRSWRAARAKALAKPAFLVFSDKTLSELAAALPISEAALLRITGVGPVKLEAYGDDLLSLCAKVRARYGAPDGTA